MLSLALALVFAHGALDLRLVNRGSDLLGRLSGRARTRHSAHAVDLILTRVLLDQVAQLGKQRSLNILQDTLIELNAKPDVFLLVELDHQLGRVERALVRVPLHEVLEALLILQNGAEAAKTDPFERVITILDQVQQDLHALNVQEVQLGALVPIDSILQAVESRQDESGRVARLVHLTVLHVVLENLDAALSSEHLLIVTAVFADVRQDVEGQLTDVKRACSRLILNQIKKSLDQSALHQVNLEEIEETC